MDDTPAERPRRTLLRYAAVSFAGALALFLTTMLLLAANLAGLQRSHAESERTAQLLQRADVLEIQLRDAETGQRGYLLTGERRYLAPYNDAVAEMWSDFDALRSLTATDPAQTARLDRLKPLIERKLDELRRTVELRATDQEAALAIVRTDEGKRLMDEIRVAVAEFRGVERSRLRERAAAEERQAARSAALTVAAAALAIVGALIGLLLLVRQRHQERLERTVEERTASLVEANRDLDAFAYMISHDLRAPLRAMHGYADALAEDHADRLDQEARGFIRRIAAAAAQMDELIRDLLSYSRLSRADLVCQPVSLTRLVDGLLTDHAGAIERAGASVEVERPLPDVAAHRPALRQALANLLTNALKFVAPGAQPRIRIRAERRGRFARLWVEDSGIGIAPESQQRIFRPFERLHGAERYEGTGIGLAIVRRSLERMGGASGVVSRPGEGSAFWIELPGVERTSAAAERRHA